MSASRSGHIREINGPILRIHLPGGRNGEQVRIGGLEIVGEKTEVDKLLTGIPQNANVLGKSSAPVTLYAPDVPDGIEVTLTWDTVDGVDGGGSPLPAAAVRRATRPPVARSNP